MKMTAFVAAIAVAVGVGGIAHAQGYPSHPITMIVPFPAGGPTDTLARILSERMRLSLGQPVIIETVTGAGASIGVARAAQAAPDGYTLSIGNWTSHVGAGAMYPAAHDAVLELQPVSRISAFGSRASSPASSGTDGENAERMSRRSSGVVVSSSEIPTVCASMRRKFIPRCSAALITCSA